MEIIVGKTSGFCQGVAFTIKKATEYLKEANQNNEKLYCLGEIVHNERIIEKLIGETFAYAPKFNYIINGLLMRYENDKDLIRFLRQHTT